MDSSKFKYSERYKGGKILSFDFDIRKETKHSRNTFRSYKSLLHFLEQNPKKKIYITKTKTDDFYEEKDNLVINLEKYQKFCDELGRNGQNRAQAFFARKLRHYSEEEKGEIIKNATEDQIIESIRNFSKEQKQTFLGKLKSMKNIELPQKEFSQISYEEFIASFDALLKDPAKRSAIVANYASFQLSVLKSHKKFLEENLDKSETFIQNWIDGKIDDQGKEFKNIADDKKKRLKKSRCLIFGLEFIDHKREGNISSNRFDVLARLSEGKSEYVLIELKSPNAQVFEKLEKENQNQGKSTQYLLSKEVSRAIPQILRYRDNLESKPAEDEDWQRIGLPKQSISKCIILIGKREDDALWESHFSSLRRSFSSSLEILTYSDLIKKIETTISNLENNL